MKNSIILLSILMSLKLVGYTQGGQSFSAVASFDTPNVLDRHLEVTVANNLALNNAYSIEAWIKVPSTSDGYVYVLESYSSTPGFGGYQLSISNGKVAATVYGLSVQSGFSNSSIAYDTWQHIAATYDGADELKIYLNGTLDNTFNFGIDNFNFATELYIGANGAGSPNTESILIDEVRIWEDVRTANEISDNINICLSGTESNLVLYYDFEQSGGVGFITDQSGSGNHATVIREQTNSLVTGVFSCCNIDTSTTVSGTTITALQSGATYQWLDCTNGNTIINGENNQSFTPLQNGDYAVEITDGSCVDTSACISILSTDIKNTYLDEGIFIYPNPVKERLHLSINEQVEMIQIIDMYGELIQEEKELSFSVENLSSGVYILVINTINGISYIQFVKE